MTGVKMQENKGSSLLLSLSSKALRVAVYLLAQGFLQALLKTQTGGCKIDILVKRNKIFRHSLGSVPLLEKSRLEGVKCTSWSQAYWRALLEVRNQEETGSRRNFHS